MPAPPETRFDRLLAGLHALVVGGWLGAALLGGFRVAPLAFERLPSRAEAGAFVGSMLWWVNGWLLAAGVLALGAVLFRGGARRRWRAGVAAGLAAMGVFSVVIQLRIHAMREALGPIDQLDVDDPARRAFGAMHGLSMLLLLVAMLLAAASVLLEPFARGRTEPG